MATVKVNANKEIVHDAPKGDRDLRWAAYLDNYKQKNPVKYAAKKAAGQFDKVPDSFK